jgi:acetylornithine deacetylase/succinyl-diaminopimelate desuccinylase-like protein
VRLPGRGTGPSLGFLGHLDVVVARREDWSEEPFAAVERDGAICGRGTVDMKCQVAATAVALARLAREGFEPNGDVMLLLMADEEVGDAGVGAPFFVEARPDLRPTFVIGEGAGERYGTSAGPIYLLDHGVKATASATLTVRGRDGDASLPDAGPNAVLELARLLVRLADYRSPIRVLPEVAPVIDAAAPGDGPPELRLAAAPLRHAIEAFLADRDPEARLVPTLGYGFSDCHVFREAYGCVAHGFIPFRHADALTNLETKHGPDERVLVDDLVFQTDAAMSVARTIGRLTGG